MRHMLFSPQDAHFMTLPEAHQSVNRTPVTPSMKGNRQPTHDCASILDIGTIWHIMSTRVVRSLVGFICYLYCSAVLPANDPQPTNEDDIFSVFEQSSHSFSKSFPRLSLEVVRQMNISGPWGAGTSEVVSGQTGKATIESIRHGRFSVEMKDSIIPWINGEGKLLAYNMGLTYDGDKMIAVYNSQGTPEQKSPREEVVISVPNGFLLSQADNFFGFRFLPGVFSPNLIKAEASKLDGYRKWSWKASDGSVELFAQYEGNDGITSKEWIKINDVKSPFLSKYYTEARQKNGKLITADYYEALDSVNITAYGRMMPSKVKIVYTYPTLGTENEYSRIQSEISYTFGELETSKEIEDPFTPTLSRGYYVKDERLGLSFRLSDDAQDVLKSLYKSKK